MSDKKRYVPLLQRYADSGAVRESVAGVEASRKKSEAAPGSPDDGAATWNVAERTLAGRVPRAGDYLRDAHGDWWQIKAVGELASGEYPCECVSWADPTETADGGDE